MRFSWYDLLCIFLRIYHYTVASALSIMFVSCLWLIEQLLRDIALQAILLFNRLIIALDCGFFTVVGFEVIPNFWSISWNLCPIYSPSLCCVLLVLAMVIVITMHWQIVVLYLRLFYYQFLLSLIYFFVARKSK